MRQSPRRPRLGQHFLRDEAVARRIAGSLPIEADDLVVEIGAGHGALTHLLSAGGQRLSAIEIDPALAAALRAGYQDNPSVEILEQDVLSVSIEDLCRRRGAALCCVFGNLPYYITSPILHRLCAARSTIRRMALLMQLEVARRVTASPGRREYGYLSVAVQSASRPRIAFDVPPGAFAPPPKVDSALVVFEVIPPRSGWDDDRRAAFLEFAGRCFGHKRKSLANNLAPFFDRSQIEPVMQALSLAPFVRAEQLSVESLANLFESLQP